MHERTRQKLRRARYLCERIFVFVLDREFACMHQYLLLDACTAREGRDYQKQRWGFLQN
jgi:hypothetical protein